MVLNQFYSWTADHTGNSHRYPGEFRDVRAGGASLMGVPNYFENSATVALAFTSPLSRGASYSLAESAGVTESSY